MDVDTCLQSRQLMGQNTQHRAVLQITANTPGHLCISGFVLGCRLIYKHYFLSAINTRTGRWNVNKTMKWLQTTHRNPWKSSHFQIVRLRVSGFSVGFFVVVVFYFSFSPPQTRNISKKTILIVASHIFYPGSLFLI